MRPTVIDIAGIVECFDTLPSDRIIGAYSRYAVLHRDSICAGVGAKVMVEGAVLLHDDNDMLDLCPRYCQL